MDNDYEARLFELLQEAMLWPSAEYAERAVAACAEGPVAAAELLATLRRDVTGERFLADQAWEGLDVENGSAEVKAPRQVGEKVGHYRLLEPLGEGGMGQVFLAEQDDPQRLVALKLMRPGTLSVLSLERFRAEQQAQARLSHPHIAQFHEAGLSEDDEPYFAMEWVDGRAIDVFFADQPPDLDQRLEIFLQVCAAIRHAHQRQVVHRDLKPSNVLVSEVEHRPFAKVIDFGIAEALDRAPGELPLTGSGKLFGTPEYLSPESFDGDIDTRADVYSLGVLLYELVTGHRPFRRSRDAEALVEAIRRGDLLSPGEAIRGASDLPFSEEGDRYRWLKRVRGDLESIIRKAMHPNRERRYGSVEDLAKEVERFLAHQPVEARPATYWHDLRLLFRRRKGSVITAAFIALLILLGTVSTALGWRQARREAEATRIALEDSEELVQFLTDLFQESDPGQRPGADITARELLDQGAERLRKDLEGQPLARARLTRTIGDIYAKLGLFAEALPLLEESLELYTQNYGESHLEVARALHGLAVMATKAGQTDEAKELFERALAIQKEHPEAREQIAMTTYHLGVLAYLEKEYDSARAYFAVACSDRLEQEDRFEESELLARCLHAAGSVHYEQGQFEQAESLVLRSLALRERLLGPDHPHVAASLGFLCLLEVKRLEPEKAESACLRSYDIRRRALGEQHALVGESLDRLARVRRLQGRHGEAEKLLQQSLAIARTQPHRNGKRLSGLLQRIAWLSWLQGNYVEAEGHYRAVLEVLGPSSELGRSSVAWVGIALSQWKTGQLEVAEKELLRLYKLRRESHGPQSYRVGQILWGLAGVYRDRAAPIRNDYEHAEEHYLESLEIFRRLHRPESESLDLAEADYRELLALKQRRDATAK